MKKKIIVEKTSHNCSLPCFSSNVEISFLWPVICRIFITFEVAWVSAGLGHYAWFRNWNLLLFLQVLFPWRFAISAYLIMHSISFWICFFFLILEFELTHRPVSLIYHQLDVNSLWVLSRTWFQVKWIDCWNVFLASKSISFFCDRLFCTGLTQW